jgi:predicted nucleic acid-binding protein
MSGKKEYRVYVDTSVVNGMFDHAEQTKPFWGAVIDGKVKIIVSDILIAELKDAPEHVRQFFGNLPLPQIELVESSGDTEGLANQYIKAGFIGISHLNDCKHIAIATINNADYLVSWNFRHIVNVNKIHRYNGVNLINGYSEIEIITPNMLINGDEDNDDDKT